MPEPITLYGSYISGNCLKPKWVADRLGVPVKWIETDAFDGSTRTPAFLKLNPAGQVPLAVLADGRTLAQSNAIMIHLAEGSALIPSDSYQRAKMYEWMFWEQYSHEPYIAVRIARLHYLKTPAEDLDPKLLTRGNEALARTLKLVSGQAPAMVWHTDTALPAGTDLVVIPGGFSYGDYLRCGAIAARSPVMDAVRAHAARGGLVLGVCNGFQILCEAGLLPGVLMRNENLRFICRDVYLRVERSDTPFTRGYNAGQVIKVPIAHGEGNYIADGETIARLEGEGRVIFRYAAPDGMIDPNWNHNGAMNAIAGILNERGNVLGMMPHPENHVEASIGSTDGRGLFAGLVDHLAKAA